MKRGTLGTSHHGTEAIKTCNIYIYCTYIYILYQNSSCRFLYFPSTHFPLPSLSPAAFSLFLLLLLLLRRIFLFLLILLTFYLVPFPLSYPSILNERKLCVFLYQKNSLKRSNGFDLNPESQEDNCVNFRKIPRIVKGLAEYVRTSVTRPFCPPFLSVSVHLSLCLLSVPFCYHFFYSSMHQCTCSVTLLSFCPFFSIPVFHVCISSANLMPVCTFFVPLLPICTSSATL